MTTVSIDAVVFYIDVVNLFIAKVIKIFAIEPNVAILEYYPSR